MPHMSTHEREKKGYRREMIHYLNLPFHYVYLELILLFNKMKWKKFCWYILFYFICRKNECQMIVPKPFNISQRVPLSHIYIYVLSTQWHVIGASSPLQRHDGDKWKLTVHNFLDYSTIWWGEVFQGMKHFIINIFSTLLSTFTRSQKYSLVKYMPSNIHWHSTAMLWKLKEEIGEFDYGSVNEQNLA